MNKIEIQSAIIRAVQRLNEVQQLKLLDFINAMTGSKQKEAVNPLVRFAGYFAPEDLRQMQLAIKDAEKIDTDEW